MADYPVLVGVVNLTPDSFYEASRVSSVDEALARMELLRGKGCSIFDLGAVSTRPGAGDVPPEEEWARLEPLLSFLAHGTFLQEGECISIDTTSSLTVRRAYALAGPFIVNDISAGEDDPGMLPAVAELGLGYIAMHKRGNPRSMDALTSYARGVVEEVLEYFGRFSALAEDMGLRDWILDPGFGFAKTARQNWELLEGLGKFRRFGKPVLAGVADKRFTRTPNPFAENAGDPEACCGTRYAEELALRRGADMLRIH